MKTRWSDPYFDLKIYYCNNTHKLHFYITTYTRHEKVFDNWYFRKYFNVLSQKLPFITMYQTSVSQNLLSTSIWTIHFQIVLCLNLNNDLKKYINIWERYVTQIFKPRVKDVSSIAHHRQIIRKFSSLWWWFFGILSD